MEGIIVRTDLKMREENTGKEDEGEGKNKT